MSLGIILATRGASVRGANLHPVVMTSYHMVVTNRSHYGSCKLNICKHSSEQGRGLKILVSIATNCKPCPHFVCEFNSLVAEFQILCIFGILEVSLHFLFDTMIIVLPLLALSFHYVYHLG